MDLETVSGIIETAIKQLVSEQPELLNLDVTERALSHHLAIYLTHLFPDDLDVDVEYNRHGDLPKRLNLPPREALDRELRATTVFPDIIIHKRNTDDYNLCVLELKKPYGSLEYDEIKLDAFRNELGYSYTAHLIFGKDQAGKLIKDLIWCTD